MKFDLEADALRCVKAHLQEIVAQPEAEYRRSIGLSDDFVSDLASEPIRVELRKLVDSLDRIARADTP